VLSEKKQPRQLKQHPKHNPKLHIWGAISYHGASQVVMFGGIMDAKRYTKILDQSLLLFINSCFPEDHRFQQNNDPKHCSKHVEKYF